MPIILSPEQLEEVQYMFGYGPPAGIKKSGKSIIMFGSHLDSRIKTEREYTLLTLHNEETNLWVVNDRLPDTVKEGVTAILKAFLRDSLPGTGSDELREMIEMSFKDSGVFDPKA